jgi:hypothetical protein
MLQSPKPALHVAIVQVPAVHVPVAFAGAHILPQPPQCIVLVCVSVSQPFMGLPSQSLRPCSHMGGGGPASASIVDTVPSVIDAPSRNRTSA